jgi:hypothetical protein
LLPIVYQLSFLDHVHHFDPCQGTLCSPKRFEPEHGPGDPFDCAVVLFHDVVEMFDLTDFDRQLVLRVAALNGGGVGPL